MPETYAPHESSTLHNNPSGELLAHILASPISTTGWARWEDRNRSDGLPSRKRSCKMARACQTLVCYTNPASLTRFACTAVSVACAIMDFICNWFGC